MRRKRKIDWAVTVIHKYYMGWQVRRQFRSQFKRVAGPKIAKFFVVILVRIKKHSYGKTLLNRTRVGVNYMFLGFSI